MSCAEPILKAVYGERFIALSPRLARALGSIECAIFLQNLMFWCSHNEDGWTYHTADAIEEETTLTRRQQELCRKKLVERGIIKEQRIGMPPILHFQIQWDAVAAILIQRKVEFDAPNVEYGENSTPPNVELNSTKGRIEFDERAKHSRYRVDELSRYHSLTTFESDRADPQKRKTEFDETENASPNSAASGSTATQEPTSSPSSAALNHHWGSFSSDAAVPPDVANALRDAIGDNAKTFHESTAGNLASIGFTVTNEFRVPNRGDGHAGFVDIVATRGDINLAIECDWKSPRKKSLFKLNQIANVVRIVSLREPKQRSPKPKPAQKTTIPDDFALDGHQLHYAIDHGMSAEVAALEFESMRNWASYKRPLYADWPAVWRNWVLRWQKDHPGTTTATPPASRGFTSSRKDIGYSNAQLLEMIQNGRTHDQRRDPANPVDAAFRVVR